MSDGKLSSPQGSLIAALQVADEAASVAHDFIHGLKGVTAEEASAAIWRIHQALRPILGEPSHPPEQRPNAGNKIRVLGSTLYLDSPTRTHGVKVNAHQDEGWLALKVEADESVTGWALSFNGRDIPIYVEKPGV